MTKHELTKDQMVKCNAIIHAAATTAGATGASIAQLPLSDTAIITPVQISMVIALGAVFGIKVTEGIAKGILASFGTAFIGRAASQFVVGWIPVLGNVINATTAVGLTEAIGWLAVKHFSEDRDRIYWKKEGFNEASSIYEKKFKQQEQEFRDCKAKFAQQKTECEDLTRQHKESLNMMQECIEESDRVGNIAHNSPQIFSEIETEFEAQTGLNKLDVSFLFLATALQCLRQYLFTNFVERVDSKTADRQVKKKDEESSNRKHRWYNPTLEDIISNPVPFDAIFGSKDFNLGIGGGFTHRAKTLGHDPLLGWIVGTANIATSTLTTWEFSSYHIKTRMDAIGRARDAIANQANTAKVFLYTKNKLFNEGTKGKQIIGASLLKEAMHLKSDLDTFAGLPLPVVSSVSPKFAKELADYGIDMSNTITVTKQAVFAVLINSLIGMVHRLFYDERTCSSKKIYEIKTRKILSYSNLLATTSNVIVTAINASMSVNKSNALKNFDVGGLFVTIHRLVSDFGFMHKVKEEFIFNNFNGKILG